MFSRTFFSDFFGQQGFVGKHKNLWGVKKNEKRIGSLVENTYYHA
jgi:hypothetical protein